jgi:hypothetical protein
MASSLVETAIQSIHYIRNLQFLEPTTLKKSFVGGVISVSRGEKRALDMLLENDRLLLLKFLSHLCRQWPAVSSSVAVVHRALLAEIAPAGCTYRNVTNV